MMSLEVLAFLEVDEYLKDRIEKEWGEKAAKHTHLGDGFSIVVVDRETLAGLISVCQKS